MSPETRNKQVVQQLADAFSACDVDAMVALLADDCQYTVVGRGAPFGGTWSKAQVDQFMRPFFGSFDSFDFRVHRMLAEGDCVMLEASSDGTGPGRKIYHNVYLMMVLLNAAGQITEVKEHFDPLEVLDYMEQDA
jgi:ketosteroid isomerase-like protein